MDIFWLVLGSIFMLVGLVGCLLPILPGPPLSFLGLLVIQATDAYPFSADFIWMWLFIVVVVTGLDYIVPVYGTKRFGGTKYGIWGAVVGLVAGVFLLPIVGIILGPMLGAFIGESLAGKNSREALRAAWGSFLGFLAGTVLKLITCIVMIYQFVMHFF